MRPFYDEMTTKIPKLFSQSGSQKLLRKIATESCPEKFSNLALKLIPKAAVFQSFSKLLFDATAQSCSCFPKLLPKAAKASP